jgi:hypothetical protein
VLTCPNRAGDCNATINDYEACITEQRTTNQRWFDANPECSELTLAELR